MGFFRNNLLHVGLSVLVVIVGLAGFLYGLAVGEYHLAPYHSIKATYHWVLASLQSMGLSPRGTRIAFQATKPRWARTPRNGQGPMMKGLGYVSGVETDHKLTGVVVHRDTQAWEGVNLYTSGHKAAAYLMGMDGDILHQWALPWEEAFPDIANPGAKQWRRVHAYPDGSLLAIYQRHGLVKVNKRSELLWKRPLRAHHDMDVADDGRIFTITSRRESFPPLNRLATYENEYITILDADGNLLREISLLDAVNNSPFSGLIDFFNAHSFGPEEDPMHVNTIRWITEDRASRVRHPAFQRGNLLLASRAMNLLMVVDPEVKKVVWIQAGLTRGPHEPVITDDGQILVFDNLWKWNDDNQRSRVLKFHPSSHEITWAYHGEGLDIFRSSCCGTNQQLPNGNVLIAESGSARAIEVTPDRELVWVFHNPHTLSDDTSKHGTLYSIHRFHSNFFTGLDLSETGP